MKKIKFLASNRTNRCAQYTLCAALLSGIFLLLPDVSVAQTQTWPTAGWATATPESQNIDGDIFRLLDSQIRDGEFGFIDRLLVIRYGRLVVNEPLRQ